VISVLLAAKQLAFFVHSITCLM